MQSYNIELTEEQMRVVQKALEIYFRTLLGQPNMLAEELVSVEHDWIAVTEEEENSEERDRIFNDFIRARNKIEDLEKEIFRTAYKSAWGVPEAKTDDMMIAECIWDAIRVARGESRYPDVLPIGKEPVPKITSVE